MGDGGYGVDEWNLPCVADKNGRWALSNRVLLREELDKPETRTRRAWSDLLNHDVIRR